MDQECERKISSFFAVIQMIGTDHMNLDIDGKGRQTFDVILITNGEVDEKRYSKGKGIVFKINFDKLIITWFGPF